MKEQPLVSVIVPAYNVEDFIGPCLESLEAQTYANLEIIAVDDGSTDGTSATIGRAASRPGSRCRMLTQENRGLSGARNAGLKASHGQLVTFVDGDDTVSPVYVEALVRALIETGAELSSCGFTQYAVGEDPTFGGTPRRVRVVRYPNSIEQALYDVGVGVNAWGKLGCRELWEQHLFPEGLLYEDLATIPAVICAVPSVALVDEALYGFLTRPESITRTQTRGMGNFRDLHTAADLLARSLPAAASAATHRSFESRRALELARALNLAAPDSRGNAVDIEVKLVARELRALSMRVLGNRCAPAKLRLKVLLAAAFPSVYRVAWRAVKRREGWL